MKKLLLLLNLIIFLNLSFSQDKEVPFNKDLFKDNKEAFNEAVKQIKLGDIHYNSGSDSDLSYALTHYLKADSLNPYSADLNYKIGVCYLNSTQKFKALKHLEFANKFNTNGERFEDIDFYLGQAYQLNGEWDKAIEHYQAYKSKLGEGDKTERFFINKKISECNTGKELTAKPERVWIDNLGENINSKYPDFGPVISADNRMLFFTSRRPGGIGNLKDETGYFFEDVYYSEREFEGEWQPAKNIGEPINTESHDATVGLAPDGKSLILYRGEGRKDGNIYIAKQNDDGTWTSSQNIGETINTKYHESAATLSFDEKTLFFVSDKPGGYGAHDIYVANWDDEKQAWGEPKNVGPTLNTEYDEKGVFFHPDNKTLYFSSEGHNTMGGLDIFKSEYNAETGEWSKPVNIGAPINTPDDDVYFVVSGNERYAYYSSFREDGFGEKDIYRITFLGPKKEPLLASTDLIDNTLNNNSIKPIEKFEPDHTILITGKIIDGITEEPLEANLTVINSKTNEKISNILTEEDGSYIVAVKAGETYALTATKKGYTISSATISTSKKDAGKELNKDLKLYPPSEGDEFVLRNIYFDFDKSNLRHQSVEELDRLVKIMQDHPSLVIELGGHTDRRGSEEYNQILSEQRAKIAKDYLVKHGVSADRIKTKGYGESKPEVPGDEINKLPTKREKEEAHQRNRRTVVTILHQ
jgi:outer membrane protein OmpA-like peptidoglycan-associated protein/tetratricopeptide (TPR) repeat protein